MTSTNITIELDTNDFEFNTESDLIEQALMLVGEFASDIGAEVDVTVEAVALRHDTITVGVSGYYTEVGLFSRRWFDGE